MLSCGRHGPYRFSVTYETLLFCPGIRQSCLMLACKVHLFLGNASAARIMHSSDLRETVQR